MKSSQLVRVLRSDGWIIDRQTGSHLIMTHSVKSATIIVPFHGSKEIGKGICSRILKSAGLK